MTKTSNQATCPVCKSACRFPLFGYGLSNLELSRWHTHNRRVNDALINSIRADLMRKRGLLPALVELDVAA